MSHSSPTPSERAPRALPKVHLEVQVRFSDTDAMGHISSGSYAAFAEVGRAQFFQAIGEPVESIPWFVLGRLELDFVSEARFGQTITLDTRCVKLGQKSMTLEQLVHADGKLACRVGVVMIGFDRNTRTSLALPTHWRPTEG